MAGTHWAIRPDATRLATSGPAAVPVAASSSHTDAASSARSSTTAPNTGAGVNERSRLVRECRPHQERRLGLVELTSNRAHPGFVERIGIRHERHGVARERGRGEHVDEEERRGTGHRRAQIKPSRRAFTRRSAIMNCPGLSCLLVRASVMAATVSWPWLTPRAEHSSRSMPAWAANTPR
jgi:hypothetical protein